MYLDLTRQFKLGNPAQILAQDFFLDLELMFVAGVLVLASAATPEVGTAGLDAVRRGLKDTLNSGAREAGLLFREFRLNFLPIQSERDEYGLAGSAGIGSQASETVAAVDQLFNCEKQEMILRHGSEL